MICMGGLKVDILIKFLSRLFKTAKRKVYLIVDKVLQARSSPQGLSTQSWSPIEHEGRMGN